MRLIIELVNVGCHKYCSWGFINENHNEDRFSLKINSGKSIFNNNIKIVKNHIRPTEKILKLLCLKLEKFDFSPFY